MRYRKRTVQTRPTVPNEQSFELTEDKQIYHSSQFLRSKQIKLVRDELDNIVEAGIIRHESPVRSSLVVIASTTDGKLRFFVKIGRLTKR